MPAARPPVSRLMKRFMGAARVFVRQRSAGDLQAPIASRCPQGFMTQGCVRSAGACVPGIGTRQGHWGTVEIL